MYSNLTSHPAITFWVHLLYEDYEVHELIVSIYFLLKSKILSFKLSGSCRLVYVKLIASYSVSVTSGTDSTNLIKNRIKFELKCTFCCQGHFIDVYY